MACGHEFNSNKAIRLIVIIITFCVNSVQTAKKKQFTFAAGTLRTVRLSVNNIIGMQTTRGIVDAKDLLSSDHETNPDSSFVCLVMCPVLCPIHATSLANELN